MGEREIKRRRLLEGIAVGSGVVTMGNLGGSMSGDGDDRTTANASSQSPIQVSIVDADESVSGGGRFRWSVAVENTGTAPERPTVEVFVDDEYYGSTTLTVESGETRELATRSHLAYPGEEERSVMVRAETSHDFDEHSVAILPVDELGPDVTAPTADLEVQPDTTVLFEVGAIISEESQLSSWWVDETYVGDSLHDPAWQGEYFYREDAHYLTHAFEAEGTHHVTAGVESEVGNYRASWTVDVTPDGATEPRIEGVSPDEGTVDVTRDGEFEFEVDVVDPDGNLDRVVWWLGHADVILGVSDLDGGEDTGSLSADAERLCYQCPIVVWVLDESGAFVGESPWRIGELVDPGASLSIIETNSPVETGAVLEVSTSLSNPGTEEMTRDVDLTVGHDPELVDSEQVSVAPGETEMFDLSFETAVVEHTQVFPVRVETKDAEAREIVVVYVDDPPLLAEIVDTNDPVYAGEDLEVVGELENTGDVSVIQEIHLVVGHDPDVVDTETVAVDAGDTRTVTLGYETYPARRTTEFPVWLKTDDGTAVRDVTVIGTEASGLGVTITETNDPVFTGEVLEVIADVENFGVDDVTGDLEFVVGHDPEVVDTGTVSVDAGETETITVDFETAIVENDQTFPVWVTVEDASDTADVTVIAQEPPAPDAELEVVDYQILGDDPNEEYVTIQNTGDEAIDASGWRLRDRWGDGRVADGQVIPLELPDGFVLDASEEVTIISGDGTDTVSTLYWEYGFHIWNQDGDVVIMLDENDEVVLEEEIGETDTDVPISLEVVDYQILGDDPNEEYITIENTGNEAIDASEWIIEDEHRVTVNLSPFEFPDGFTLTSGGQVTIVSGDGTDTDETLYWGLEGGQIWNQDEGDVITVLDGDGEVILERELTAEAVDAEDEAETDDEDAEDEADGDDEDAEDEADGDDEDAEDEADGEDEDAEDEADGEDEDAEDEADPTDDPIDGSDENANGDDEPENTVDDSDEDEGADQSEEGPRGSNDDPEDQNGDGDEDDAGLNTETGDDSNTDPDDGDGPENDSVDNSNSTPGFSSTSR